MIVVRNLTFRFRKKIIFNNINFNVKKGEFFGITGINGSGKTTLIRIILGLIDNYSGDISISGNPKINYQPENINKKLSITGLEYLREYFRIYGIESSAENQNLKFAIELAGLGEEIFKQLNHLSKGNLQRLSFARTFLNDPDLIFLDEPFSNIDPEARDSLINKLLEFKGSKTIIISSHRNDEIIRLCDRVGTVSNGELRIESNHEG
ncbi:MAG: ABC transporter ATP-binding protein [bacterium]|nr:ABC transporter ATP-binding protein [bacterium]